MKPRNFQNKIDLENMPSVGALVYELNNYKKELINTKEKAVSDVEEVISLGKEVLTEAESTVRELDGKYSKLSDEVVEALNDIKSNGLKGEKGDDADEDAIEERLLAKIPKIETIVKKLPTKAEIVDEVIKQIPKNKPSLKIIQESIDIDQVVEKVEEKLNEKPFEISKINGLSGRLDNITRDIARKTGYSGGGDTVAAGTNVTITTNSAGAKVINATGGGGGGGLTQVYVAISGATAAGSTAATWYTYDSTGTVTLTLPTAVGNTSLYSCRCVSGVLTVATTGGQTINGSTAEIYPLAALTIQSNGTNWIII